MEKRMKELQTPQRDPAANRRWRKPQKIAKSLHATFSSLPDDKVQAISKDSADFSPFSEFSDISQIQDIDRNFLQVANPALSASCESSLLPDFSPSSVVTVDKKEPHRISVNFDESNDLDEVSAAEAEIAVNFFRHALSQVLQSTDVDHQSKKLIDASMRIIADNFLAIPQERDQIVQLISAKSHLLPLCFLLWITVLALTFFFGSGVKSSFTGPPPT